MKDLAFAKKCQLVNKQGYIKIKKLYDFWSFNFMPIIGKKITGDKDAYTYLVESIRKFPNQNELSEMFSEAGFSRVRYRNLSNGIVSLHSGWKF